MKLYHLYKSVLVGFVFFTASSLSAAMTEEVVELQDEWARIKYLLPEKEQESAFQLLSEKAAKVSDAHQDNAEALVWEGIILSTYAGVKGGLGALGLAKQARTVFEHAIEIDPSVMHGSAYTSLGSLYYQVPSWPVGFGDDDKAMEYLTKGLELNPDGIDSNYFYGDYLLKRGDYVKAEEAFNKALLAPAREGREIADKGRHDEIEEAMAKLKSQQTVAGKKNSLF
jgi:tetratricopeptide (TPR) repeat protein